MSPGPTQAPLPRDTVTQSRGELQSVDRDIIGDEVNYPWGSCAPPAVRRSEGPGRGRSIRATRHNPRDEFWYALAGLRPTLAFFAPLGAFLAGLAFVPALGFFGATFAPRALTRAFFVGFWGGVGYRLRRFSLFHNRCHVFSFVGGDYRVTTSITQVGAECKAIVNREKRWWGDGRLFSAQIASDCVR
jgi:hypothetical protein